jgi:hypothetical protein
MMTIDFAKEHAHVSSKSFPAIALACVTALLAAPSVWAAEGIDLTVYRSDSSELFSATGDGSVNEGYAVVHEGRSLSLRSGSQDLSLGGLPNYLDAEALTLRFPGNNAQVISQRLLLGQGTNATLASLVGQDVTVLGSGGQTLASGTLQRAGNALLVRDANGTSTLVRDYAAVRANGSFASGSTLQLRVDAKSAGNATAALSYPTSGLGWRAAYIGSLQAGQSCRMSFESRASIANRSGRDWSAVRLKLIAGEPNIAKASAPRPMMMRAEMAMAKSAAAPPMPGQATLDDYRSYTLADAVDLPDGSVSQVPLYATRDVDCERTALYENGNVWMSPRPMLEVDGYNPGGNEQIVSTLRLRAFDSLPAGYLRVLTVDRDSNAEFLGEGRINDTPKGADASIVLGTAFDLRGARERTSFKADKAGRSIDEAFRITLSNAGDIARTITVREHPYRWRQWTLASSTLKPASTTPDTLEFKVNVPAHGKTTLDYAVHYQWTAGDDS